jgi:site-specific recombinase XerD
MNKRDRWKLNGLSRICETSGIIRRFCEELRSNRSVSTVANYARAAKYFLSYCKKPPHEIKHEDFQAWTSKLENKWAAGSARNYAVYVIKFLRWLHDKGLTNYYPQCNPVKRRTLPLRRKHGGVRVTEKDVARLCAALTTSRDKALLTVLYDTRATPSELLNLRIGDVAVQPGTVKIRFKSNGCCEEKELDIAAPYLIDWINQHPRRGDMASPLWISNNGDRAIKHTRLISIFEIAAERAGFPFKLLPVHFTRQTGA